MQKVSLCMCVSTTVTTPLLCPQRGSQIRSPGCQNKQAGRDPASETYAGSSQRANPPPLQVPRRRSRSWRRGMAVTADRRASNSKGSAPGLRTPGSRGLASTTPTPRSRSREESKSAKSLSRLAVFKQFSSFALKRSLWEAVCHI